MTRKSIEACAVAFIACLFLFFVYAAYHVAEMIGIV